MSSLSESGIYNDVPFFYEVGFIRVIIKSWGEIDYHFSDFRKTMPILKVALKEFDNILLTRYAFYLIA